MKQRLLQLKDWLAGLSMRTGMIVAGVCVACYAISFLQMLLPISVATKGVLWAVFYGLAKASQYSAILILGKEGCQALKKVFRIRFRNSE